jgi:hypothetical protein
MLNRMITTAGCFYCAFLRVLDEVKQAITPYALWIKHGQAKGTEGRDKQQKNNFTLKPVFFGGKLPIVL